MKGRILWFVAGTTAGVYGTFKAKRMADRFTPTGMADQIAAWQVGLQAFSEEVRAGMDARETELVEHLGLPPDALSRAPRVEGAGGRRALPALRQPAPASPLSPYDE
jgi:hypothetical protein